MKKILKFCAKICAVAALALSPLSDAKAASWNDGYGMGNLVDNWRFSGSGAPLGVQTSVVSNQVYYITSAYASGCPTIDQILFKTDTLASLLSFYVATNTWTCASNQPANTNILWLTTTNSMMATNDPIVHWSAALDSYTLTYVSGNATDARGTVYTNASGYVGISIFQTMTNTIAAGDKIFKMATIASFNPMNWNSITNYSGSTNEIGKWLPFGRADGPFIKFHGKIGVPAMVALTYSNAASTFISGEYFVRTRR